MTQFIYEIGSQTSIAKIPSYDDIMTKARPEQVRQHPSHPEYKPLPVSQKELDELNKVQTELKEIRHEISKTIHDYLELYED